LILNITLVPQYGIQGAAVAANISLLVPALIGCWKLYTVTEHMQSRTEGRWKNVYSELIAPILAIASGTVVMAVVLYAYKELIWSEKLTRLGTSFYSIAAVAAGGLVYGAILLIWRVVSVREWKSLS